MNWVDFWVMLIVVLLVLAVIFFRYILPKIKHRPSKKARELIKSYHKEKEKEDRKGSSKD